MLNVKDDYFANNTAHGHQGVDVVVIAIKRCYLHAAEGKRAAIVCENEICFRHSENTDMACNNLIMADASDTIYLATVVRY